MEFVLLILFLIGIFIFSLFRTKIKGIEGETAVSIILYALDKSSYKIINNIVLKTGENTSQIDHVVISDFGVIVIETKNYKGWIFGYENSEYWTQAIYGYKSKFYNPIRQNSGHIRALRKCLADYYPSLEYKSVIVFTESADIKVTSVTDVINTHRLLPIIKNCKSNNLSETDKNDIFQKINAANVAKTYN